MKLRLLLNKDCDRSCAGCCNKDWDLDNLPICKTYKDYEEIILTGGEPMLYPVRVLETINEIRTENPKAKIILYTAKPIDDALFRYMMCKLDGITITFHEQKDVGHFNKVWRVFYKEELEKKIIRLNVFKGIDISSVDKEGIRVKENMVWIKNCPLPEDEVFERIE